MMHLCVNYQQIQGFWPSQFLIEQPHLFISSQFNTNTTKDKTQNCELLCTGIQFHNSKCISIHHQYSCISAYKKHVVVLFNVKTIITHTAVVVINTVRTVVIIAESNMKGMTFIHWDNDNLNLYTCLQPQGNTTTLHSMECSENKNKIIMFTCKQIGTDRQRERKTDKHEDKQRARIVSYNIPICKMDNLSLWSF